MAVTQYTDDDAALTSLDGTYYSAAHLAKLYTASDKMYAAGTSENLNREAGYGNAYDDSAGPYPAVVVVESSGDANATLLPAGAAVPANLTALQALAPLASPSAAIWDASSAVTLGTGTAHWDGAAWATGASPGP